MPARLKQSGRSSARAGRPTGRQDRHPAPHVAQSGRHPAPAIRSPRREYRADWRRPDRRGPWPGSSPPAGFRRAAGISRAALRLAQPKASGEDSKPMPVALGNSFRAAIRMAPEPVPRSAILQRRGTVRHQPQRLLDQGLGIGARHQHAGADFEIQAPEFLVAGDIGEGLARRRGAPPGAANAARLFRRRRVAVSVWSRLMPSAWANRSRASHAGIVDAGSGQRPRGFVQGHCSSRRFEFRQPVGLVLGHQRVDDLAQFVAGDDARQIVERQVDAVVGDAALREIIGADALAAVARPHQALALRWRAPASTRLRSAS